MIDLGVRVIACPLNYNLFVLTFQRIPNDFQNRGTFVTCAICKHGAEQLEIRPAAVENAAHSAFDQDLALCVGINIKLIFVKTLEQNGAHLFPGMSRADIELHFLQILPVSRTGIVGIIRLLITLRAISVGIVQIGLTKLGQNTLMLTLEPLSSRAIATLSVTLTEKCLVAE